MTGPSIKEIAEEVKLSLPVDIDDRVINEIAHAVQRLFVPKLKPLSEEARSYNLLNDYKKLYQLVISGIEVVCFVDYSFRDGGNVSRDVCRIRRFGVNHIEFLSRGIGYGGVNEWDIYDEYTEYSEFEKECQRMNVEFIEPGNN